MANYPQLDDCSGVWTLKEVNDAVMGGYWREAGSRGVFGGGYTPSAALNVMEFITMASTGDVTDFGDLSGLRQNSHNGNVSSFTRNTFAGGYHGGSVSNQIDYVTIMSAGNSADFGNLSVATGGEPAGMSNSTRGIYGTGGIAASPGETNTISYITMASTGDVVDFGDATVARFSASGLSNTTRGIMAGGGTPTKQNTIDFIEIATTGNATDFGDLGTAKTGPFSCASSTIGFIAGGANGGSSNVIEKINIASQSNALDFGDLVAVRNKGIGTTNSLKAIFAGGNPASDVIEETRFSTGGDTTDFGDLSAGKAGLSAGSNAHGGLNDGYQGTRFIDSPIGGPVPRGGGVGDLSVKVGGEGAAAVALIGFNIISTAGNENLFGDLTNGARYDTNGCAGDTRMFTWSGTLDGTGGVNSIDYLTFSHKGNTADFGDATETRQVAGCLANSTRALGAGGATPSNSNVIDYITIATIGNASDFGDLTSARKGPGGLASTTRGVFGGGTGLSNVMDYVTIASAGNATDFGDLTQARRSAGATSSSTRGVFAGGRRVDSPAAESEVIDYITIASTGDASDFGDLTQNRAFLDGTSNSTRAIFTGGYSGSNRDEIDFVTIASTGDASDFGDLMLAARGAASGSNGHGGLS
jgi:hypothetical protein